jgi:hypothetical protein
MRLEIYDSEQLNFVELNTTGDNENYIKCDENSRYIDTEVFNLFAHCFENSQTLYEYFGPTKYNARKIVPLRNELIKHQDELNAIDSKESFIEFIGNIFLGKEFIFQIELFDKAWEDNWSLYLTKLSQINKEMIEIVEDCIEYEKILWVIGY